MRRPSTVPSTEGASFQSDFGAVVLVVGVGLMMVATFVFGSLTLALVAVQQLL